MGSFTAGETAKVKSWVLPALVPLCSWHSVFNNQERFWKIRVRETAFTQWVSGEQKFHILELPVLSPSFLLKKNRAVSSSASSLQIWCALPPFVSRKMWAILSCPHLIYDKCQQSRGRVFWCRFSYRLCVRTVNLGGEWPAEEQVPTNPLSGKLGALNWLSGICFSLKYTEMKHTYSFSSLPPIPFKRTELQLHFRHQEQSYASCLGRKVEEGAWGFLWRPREHILRLLLAD